MNLWDVLASQPLAYLGSALLLGLIVGSFLNVLIHRLPLMMERHWRDEAREALELAPQPGERFDLFLPPSHCPHCQHRAAQFNQGIARTDCGLAPCAAPAQEQIAEQRNVLPGPDAVLAVRAVRGGQ
jgi:hypothetical protein